MPGPVVGHRLRGVEFLLFRIWNVVRSDDVDRSSSDSLPESILGPLFAQRGVVDIQSPIRSLEVVPCEMQVDPERFDINRQPTGLGFLGDTQRPFR